MAVPPANTRARPVTTESGTNGCPLALDIRDVTVRYNNVLALEHVTFAAAQQEIVGIIGPNGSGKSTLMKCIMGLVKPRQGQILVLGQPNTEQRKLIGYMPQVEDVEWDFPVTVADVALMGRYARRGLFRRPTREDRAATDAALQRLGMYEFRRRLIGELSGGQRRRVLLARALANNPTVLLMDEPMAGLDARAQHRLLDIMNELRDEGTTVVLSTHDLSCVSTCAARVACLNQRLLAFGDPAEVLTEKVLNQTFGTHLLLVHLDGQAYAYQHHNHPSPATFELPDREPEA